MNTDENGANAEDAENAKERKFLFCHATRHLYPCPQRLLSSSVLLGLARRHRLLRQNTFSARNFQEGEVRGPILIVHFVIFSQVMP